MKLKSEVNKSGNMGRIEIALKTFLALLAFTVSALLSMEVPAKSLAAETKMIRAGQRIYNEGILPSGKLLAAYRYGKIATLGAESACVYCHRRSGMGQVEGDIQVPPITGNYLYATPKDFQVATMDPHVGKSFNLAHEPYTETSFAQAINRGINNKGQVMNLAMPVYDMSKSELKALTAYLKQLSSQWSPGVTDSRIRFATVITPEVDPVKRKAFIDLMQTIIRQKNGSTRTGKSGLSRRHMTSAAELVLGTERKWDLDIWELQGEPASWGKQLKALYRKQPVFALMSGLSSSTWQPVDNFCNQERVPCWFPSVELPSKSQSEYTFYFSQGVLLEAAVMARHMLDDKSKTGRLIQIYRDDRVGQAASQELMHALDGSTIKVENRPIKGDKLSEVLTGIQSGDIVMCWLPGIDIAELDKSLPVSGVSYYFSSQVASHEHLPLSDVWKTNSRLVYLYELPELRELNLSYFHVWMNTHKLPLVDEPMQSEVYFALSFMTDSLAEMLNNIYRDYLVERAETMINKREGVKAAQESRDRMSLGRVEDIVRKHGTMTAEENVRLKLADQVSVNPVTTGTTIYPRLSLGPGQRFASKGGYIVRFSEGKDEKLIAESGWIIP